MSTNTMESYQELKDRHGKEFGEFPIAFAFSDKQLQEALVKLNATKEECCSIGAGGIIKKADSAALKELFKRHTLEQEEAFKSDDMLIEAIKYELGNHEYGYTYDSTDTVNALALDLSDERVNKCFVDAKKQYLAENEDN